jgi:hypothetical protein
MLIDELCACALYACLQQLEQAAITASLQSYAKDTWRKKRRRTDTNDSSNSSSSSSSSNSSKAALNLKLEKGGKAGGSSAPGGKEARHRYHSVPGGSSSSSSDARSYPLAVQEMIMNGFPLEQVQAAFELVGDNLDDLLAVLMQQQP